MSVYSSCIHILRLVDAFLVVNTRWVRGSCDVPPKDEVVHCTILRPVGKEELSPECEPCCSSIILIKISLKYNIQ